MLEIAAVTTVPLDLELREPFGIAGGGQERAANALVRITLRDGSYGLGEAAPFPAVTGETQALVLDGASRLEDLLVGGDARRLRFWSNELLNVFGSLPSLRCAVECALLDVICRRAGLSLWTYFGAAEPELDSDITIPTGDAAHARASAANAHARGFGTLKLKVGGVPLGADLERIAALVEVAPDLRIVLDANASLEASAALELLAGARALGARIALFEQPTAAGDWQGLRTVREVGKVPVAADESARTAQDVVGLASQRSADVINLKIMKSGVLESVAMAQVARAHGLGLMIGGMVESRLAMSVSACFAAGLGGFTFVDLDTPWFMTTSRVSGGYGERGSKLCVSEIQAGHGVAVEPG